MNETHAADEAATTVPVADVPWKEEQPSAHTWLHKGDKVHARLELQPKDGEEEQVMHLDFTISGINGSRIYGSIHHPEGLSQKDGWRFELLSAAQALPETLSEIEATMRTGYTVSLMGKGTVWVDANGTTVDPSDIVSFTTN